MIPRAALLKIEAGHCTSWWPFFVGANLLLARLPVARHSHRPLAGLLLFLLKATGVSLYACS